LLATSLSTAHAQEAPVADLAVTYSLHTLSGGWDGGPAYSGDHTIEPGDIVKAVFRLQNDGPDTVVAEFRLHNTFNDPPWWLWGPHADINAWQGNNSDCDSTADTCAVELDPEETYAVSALITAATAGYGEFFATLSSDAEDPDDGNNATSLIAFTSHCNIEGTPGDDELRGTARQAEVICAGEGDDVIEAGLQDRVFGGDGDDMIVPARAGIHFGGDGLDTIDFSALDRGITLKPAADGITNARDDLYFEAHFLGVEGWIGTSYSDTLRGSARADHFWGLSGRDRIIGGGGRDRVSAGRGEDTVNAGAGRDRAVGGKGSDRFFVEDGQSDRVRGGPGADRAVADRTLDVLSSARIER
jgi:Ca2+-binding RTX toxin-like protein